MPAPHPATDGTGEIFARHIRDALDDMERTGIRPAGLLVDTIFSSDGVFADPPGTGHADLLVEKLDQALLALDHA
ncbi:MAG: hypothetical protein WAV72_04415 [Bradyrhizobium sp.]